MVTLAVFALSLPLLQGDDAGAERPLTLIIDDSAAAAPIWDGITDEARRRVRDAQRANQDIVLLLGAELETTPIPAAEALLRLRSATPRLRNQAAEFPSPPTDRQTVYLSLVSVLALRISSWTGLSAHQQQSSCPKTLILLSSLAMCAKRLMGLRQTGSARMEDAPRWSRRYRRGATYWRSSP